jgi:hypothetical protein
MLTDGWDRRNTSGDEGSDGRDCWCVRECELLPPRIGRFSMCVFVGQRTRPCPIGSTALLWGQLSAMAAGAVLLSARGASLVRSSRRHFGVFELMGSAEFGSLFEIMRDTEQPRTPLQQRMDELGRRLTVFSLGRLSKARMA